jgi:hypothetical protein
MDMDEILQENIDPIWHLHDTLTVRQAASIIAGFDPSYIAEKLSMYEFKGNCDSTANSSSKVFLHEFPKIHAAESSLVNAIKAEQLNARKESVEADSSMTFKFPPLDLEETTIDLNDLKKWLLSRNFTTGFFFENQESDRPYLDKSYERYAPKLAAAVRAWENVTETQGESVKQSLVVWLNRHADEFGLTKKDGMPNESGIEETAKIANWKTGGGASKTPGGT